MVAATAVTMTGPTGGVVLNASVLPAVGAVPPPSHSLAVPAALLPYPTNDRDTVFHQAAAGRYDAVIAMYHDQGLIPFKLLHFQDGVNVTLGLPIVRTSVDHGTAYDIAGQGKADPSSLVAAVHLARTIVANRAAAASA